VGNLEARIESMRPSLFPPAQLSGLERPNKITDCRYISSAEIHHEFMTNSEMDLTSLWVIVHLYLIIYSFFILTVRDLHLKSTGIIYTHT